MRIYKRAKSIFELITEKRLTTVAGAWVFFFLTSIIPLAFLLVTAFGVFKVDLSIQILAYLPEEFRPAGEAIVSTAEKASKGATLIFILTVIFSCSTLLNQMSKDGDFIYGVKAKYKRGVMRRLWAIAAIALLFIIFLLAAFLIAFGNTFFSGVKTDNIKRLISVVLAFTFIILLSYGVILLLNRFACPIKLKISQLSVGSLCSLFVIVLGTIGFTVYLRFFNSYNAFYGSLAGIVVFLLWAYILMIGLVLGVIINSKINTISKKDKIFQQNLK